MNTVIEDVGLYLSELGFERDDSVVPDNVNDHMSYSHFNGFTLVIDDNGQGWSVKGTINPGTLFRLRDVVIVE